MNIYREELLEHSAHPHHKGRLENPDMKAREANALCGDEVQIDMRITGGRIEAIAFEGEGCVVSQAAASMLTDLILRKSLQEIADMDTSAILTMIGAPISPARMKCALLAWNAVRNALPAYAHRTRNTRPAKTS